MKKVKFLILLIFLFIPVSAQDTAPPNVTLVLPEDGFAKREGSLTFTVNLTDDYSLRNVTLYHNISGAWEADQTLWLDTGGEFQPDGNTIFLAHFNESYLGSDNEAPSGGSGTSFNVGKFGPGIDVYDSDTLSYPTEGNFNIQSGTIEFWFRPSWPADDNLQHKFFEQAPRPDDANKVTIVKEFQKLLTFYIWNSSGYERYASYFPEWNAGEWHHIAVTWNITTGEMELYFDGLLAANNTWGEIDISGVASDFYIGSSSTGVDQANSTIDELRISDVQRSASEINQSYLNGIRRYTSANVNWRISDIPDGIYKWNALAYDTAGNFSWGNDRIFLIDSIPPSYFNLKEPPDPSPFSPDASYQFNSTWIDNVGVAQVIFQFNGVNYTAEKLGDKYSYTLSGLPAGTYEYRWYGSDNAGNWNGSDTMTFTVCAIPADDMYIDSDTTLCSGTYNIVDLNASGVVIINASGVTLDCDGAVLAGTDSGYGIFVNGYSNVKLKNCIVKNYSYGIYLGHGSEWNQIDKNELSGSYAGIFLYSSCKNNTITNNSIHFNTEGIFVSSSTNNIIANNNISYNKGAGIYLELSNYNEIINNTANFQTTYGYSSGIFTYQSSNNNITKNILQENYYGIYLYDSSDFNRMSDNAANQNTYGISVEASHNNTLINNSVIQNKYGIYLFNANSNRFTNVTAIQNEGYSDSSGVYIYKGNDNLIEGSKIFENTYGVYLYFGNNNSFVGTTICYNSQAIYQSSSTTTTSNNTFCVDLQSPPDGTWINQTAHNFTFHISNILNKTSCTLYMDEIASAINSSVFDNTNTTFSDIALSEGPHHWKVICKDSQNNSGRSDVWSLGVDTSPPVLLVESPESSWYKSPLDMIFKPIDDHAQTLECSQKLDGKTIKVELVDNNTFSKTEIDASDGNHTIEITCTDRAGNSNTTEILFMIDTVSPTTFDEMPRNGSTTRDATPFTYVKIVDGDSGMDENTIEMFVNETKVTPNIIPITDGYVVVYEPSAEFPDLEEVEVSVHAEDKVGNILIYNWSFIISLSSPIPLNETPADDSYANATPMIGVNIEDEDGINKTSISMFVDGRPVYLEITNTSIYKYQVKNQTFIPFDDGKEVKVRLEVQDLNNSKLIYIWFFTIDALPPNASAEVPANGTYINQSSPVIGVNIVDRGSGVDKNTMKMVVGGEERIAEIIAIENGYRVTYTPVTTHFEDGEVNVNIAVSDKIGNAMSYWWSFMIDTLAPTASDVSPADGSVISTTKPTISIFLRDEMSGVDEDSIVMLIGKTDLSASLSKIPTEDGYRIYFTPDVGFADGVINVTVYVKDNASNQMTLTWSFRIDTSQSPLLPPSGGGGGGYIISVSSDNILDEIHAPSLEIKSIIRSFPTQITKIEILAKGEVKVEVEEIGRPENVEKPEGISYRYFQISASGEIKGAKIEFKVEKSWISENEIDESTIKLYKYSEGWVELPTSKSGEDENFSYFKSTAHGFSIFVIVGKKKVQEKKVWKEELKKEEIEKEGSKLKPNPILFSAVALVIVSLTIFIRRRNRKHRPLKELGDELEKLSSKLDEITEVE